MLLTNIYRYEVSVFYPLITKFDNDETHRQHIPVHGRPRQGPFKSLQGTRVSL